MPKLTIHTINYLRTGYQENDITPEDYVEAIMEYDDKGNVISENHYNADATISSATTTEYDEKNRPVEVRQYDGDGYLCECVVTLYNEDGQIQEQRMNYGEGMPVYVTRYVYENGVLVRRDCYDEDGFTYTEKTLSYDECKRVSVETDFDEDGRKLYIAANKYNEAGQLVECIRDEVQLHDRRTYAYEYDAEGNKTKDLIYNYDLSLIAKVYYTYNDNYQLLSQEEEDLDNYKMTKYTYEGNNLMKIAVYTKDESLVSWVDYQYDENGRVLVQEAYACDEVNPSEHRLMVHTDYIRE